MTAIRQRDQRIAAGRGFNRFYTRQIGVLRKTFLDSPYSLGEARVLYEIAAAARRPRTEIGRALDLDAGYLSRVLRNFEKRGLIERKASARDARQSHLALSARGRKAYAPLEQRSQRETGALLGKLEPANRPGDRRHDDDRNAVARGNANGAAARLHPARAAARRFRLDRQASRPSSMRRISLERTVRGRVRANRRRFRQHVR